MQYEFKQIAMLKEEGLSDVKIRQKVWKKSIFQYNKLSSLKRDLPYILWKIGACAEDYSVYTLQLYNRKTEMRLD